MNFFQLLLYPPSVLYKGIMAARNQLYDAGVLKSERFEVPVIVVGNLTVGGTGKTPHVEYLIRLLKDRKKLAVLSRGYKRKTSGYRLANEADTASTIGDEPMLYHSDFPDITVAVGEDRPAAIHKLLQLNPQPEVIVLDDAFQHRPLQASFNLLLTDYGRLFYKDHLVPAGRLRESREGASRADAVVITKAPDDLTVERMKQVTERVNRYTKPGTPVFFSAYRYGTPVPLNTGFVPLQKKVLLLTGIANPKPLQQQLEHEKYEIVSKLAYSDHFAYKAEDIEQLRQRLAKFAPGEVSVITTSKDAMRLRLPELEASLKDLPVFYVPIEVEILNGKKKHFDEMLLRAAAVEVPVN